MHYAEELKTKTEIGDHTGTSTQRNTYIILYINTDIHLHKNMLKEIK